VSDAKDFEVESADDVTEEIIERVQGIVEGWYNEGPIDWGDVWDRMENTRLNDDRGIDMGSDRNSPAIRKIKRDIRAWRKLG
jgi:hypothetical protein